MKDLKKEFNNIETDLFSYMNNDPYNFSAIIAGKPGSGVEFLTKFEIAKTYFNTEDDIIVFDDEGLFTLSNILDTKIINLCESSNYHINPLDMIDGIDLCEQIDRKTTLFKSFYEIVINSPCNDTEEYATRKALNSIYKEKESPRLIDFYNALLKDPLAKQIADALFIYLTENDRILSGETNISYDRMTIFRVDKLRIPDRQLIMLSILDNLYKKINENLKKGKKTWIFIDSLTVLLSNKNLNQYFANMWKTARLMGVKFIGITRDLETVLVDESVRQIIINTCSLELLTQSAIERNLLRNLYNLSDTDIEYITNARPGEGLLCVGNKKMSFKCKVDKESVFYKKAILNQKD